jgi:hypothetical protein
MGMATSDAERLQAAVNEANCDNESAQSASDPLLAALCRVRRLQRKERLQCMAAPDTVLEAEMAAVNCAEATEELREGSAEALKLLDAK